MKGVNQISVFLSNKSGRIADVTKLLAEQGIDIIALCIADGEAYGALRLITDDGARTLSVLKNANFITKITEVLAVEIPNVPGALASVLTALDGDGIAIEYIYAFVGKSGDNARVILRVNDNGRALETLDRIGVRTLSQDEVDKK